MLYLGDISLLLISVEDIFLPQFGIRNRALLKF